MKARIIFVVLIVIMTASCNGDNIDAKVTASPGVSISLIPDADTFDLREVPQGVVGFTALVRNEGPKTITIAHPLVCFPADADRRPDDSRGKSEILLKITRPNGAKVILRDGDGFLHFFAPGNVRSLTIPANGTGTFHLGWFFQNAKGMWEPGDAAAKVFLSKGKYKVRILFRNFFPKAALYDKLAEVWTGEMESAAITIVVK